jgi:hypothetical protein
MADASTYAALGSALGGLAGNAMANSKGDGSEFLQQLLNNFNGIPLPEVEKALAQELGPSAMEGVSSDPQLKAAMYAALAKMQDIGQSGGMTLEDKANMAKVQNELGRNEMASRNAITNQMAARGMSNSGASVGMQFANQQAAADRAGQMGMQSAADAQRRAFDAIMSGGRMAGEMQQADLGQKNRVAEARDMLARYNAGARERAQQFNANQAQQQFDNRMNRAGGAVVGYQGLAQHGAAEAARTRQMYSDLGYAGGMMAGNAAGSGGGGGSGNGLSISSGGGGSSYSGGTTGGVGGGYMGGMMGKVAAEDDAQDPYKTKGNY